MTATSFPKLALVVLASVFATTEAVSAKESTAEFESSLPQAVSAAIASGTLKDIHWSKSELPFTGKKVFTLKAIDTSHNKVVSWSWDGAGALLTDNGKSLLKAERVTYRKDFGSVTPEMWTRMLAAKAGDQLQVLLWLPTSEVQPSKEELLADATARLSHEAKLTAVHAAARQKLYEKVPGLLAHSAAVDRAPALQAALTEPEILALAQLDEVAAILPAGNNHDTSSTVYVDAVKGSAATTGYTGNGVKVCIIDKWKPTNPTGNLSFTESAMVTIPGTQGACQP